MHDDGNGPDVSNTRHAVEKRHPEKRSWVPTFVGMTVKVGMTITGELVSHSLLNGNKGFEAPYLFLASNSLFNGNKGLQPLGLIIAECNFFTTRG